MDCTLPRSEQFGLLNFALAFAGLFGAVATLGLRGIVVRDIVRDPDSARLTLGTAALLQLLGGLFSFLLILGAIAYLRPDDPFARSIVAILGAMMLFKVGEVAEYWFESQVQSKYTVWVKNSVFLVFAGIKVVLILQQAPLAAFVWAMLAEAAIAAVILLIVMGLRGPSLARLQASFQRGKSLLQDSWPLILSAVAVTVYMKIDQIMLGQMVNDEAVGIYSAAVKISEVWYFIPVAIVASVFPSLLETKKTSESMYYARVQKLYDLMTFIALCVALPMTVLSKPMIELLYGMEYVASGAVLAIHVWGGLFVAMGAARGKWLIAEGLQYMTYWYVGMGMVVNIVGNYLLIPSYGVIGAALVTLFSQAVVAIAAPALYSKTRISTKMLLMSLHPWKWYQLVKNGI